MMCNLFIEEGDLIQLDSVSLPIATYTKFQPQSTDFLDITDPKAVYPRIVYMTITFIFIHNMFFLYNYYLFIKL